MKEGEGEERKWERGKRRDVVVSAFFVKVVLGADYGGEAKLHATAVFLVFMHLNIVVAARRLLWSNSLDSCCCCCLLWSCSCAVWVQVSKSSSFSSFFLSIPKPRLARCQSPKKGIFEKKSLIALNLSEKTP